MKTKLITTALCLTGSETTMKTNVNNILLKSMMACALAILALGIGRVTAQQTPSAAGSAFSFAVYGDSRPMMYLPYKEGQPDLTQMFVEMFGLVMPEKVAEARL